MKNYIFRDLSWLNFNSRVLTLAKDDNNHPLNERLSFLSISDSNLDEFISVRFAHAYDNRYDDTHYKEILSGIKSFIGNQQKVYNKLVKDFRNNGINITSCNTLDKKSLKTVNDIFQSEIFPLLTPINVGSINDMPYISTGQTAIAVVIDNGSTGLLNIIPIDNNINKIFKIDNNYVMVEDIIITCIDQLFINKKISELGIFKLIKDANIILNHDTSKFILDRMNDTLIERKFSDAIFINFHKSTSDTIKKSIINLFDISKHHTYDQSVILDYKRFMNINLLADKYSYKKFDPVQFDTSEEQYSIFSSISENDILLQHPYDSFDTIIKFIEHASNDDAVLGIKMTLYRVSSVDSPIVEALINASKNGKHVSVLIEIKARFDESRNIQVIEKLKNSGVNVLLGIEDLKTHCKFCIVARREESGITIYSHLGTGNYNDKTAKIYTDISYLTSKQKIGSDLLNIFNILSGISEPDEKLQKVFYAPVNFRTKLNKLIQREIEHAKKGTKAEIFLKLNSLSDEDIVERLYKAADAGVKIYIICRGVCSILPNKNIYIKSIVGRFLEHSRIYYFRNNGDDEYFISSADLFTRNLDRRVETFVSLSGSEVTDKLKYIIRVLKQDTKNSFEITQNGDSRYIGSDYIGTSQEFNAHQWFIDAANSRPKIKVPKHKKLEDFKDARKSNRSM